jgi:hypothetical protein
VIRGIIILAIGCAAYFIIDLLCRILSGQLPRQPFVNIPPANILRKDPWFVPMIEYSALAVFILFVLFWLLGPKVY